RRQPCPECQADVGVTGYGARFRIAPVQRQPLLSTSFLRGATIGALIFMFVAVQFAIDDGARRAASGAQANQPQPSQSVLDELARVPEVALHDPLPNT